MRHLQSSRLTGRLVAPVVVALLLGACSPAASPTPGGSPTTSPGTPAPTMASPTAPPATPGSPEPSATPDVTAARWIAAGDGSLELMSGTTVALPGGSALRLGMIYTDDPANSMVAQLWEPATGTWRDTTPLPKMRTDFATVVLRDGRVLVAGGYNGVDASYSSAYLFDAGSETWTKTGLMAQARTAPAAALLPDGRVLVAGGYFYQPEDEPSAFAPDMVLAVARMPAAGGDQAGPFDDVEVPPRGRALATAEIFDPATGEFTKTGAMRFARPGAAAVTLADGRVLVALATDHYVHMDWEAFWNAEVFDAATGRFTLAGELPAIDRAGIRGMGVELPDWDGQPGRLGALVALPGGGALLVGQEHWWKHEGQIVRSFRFDPAGTWADTGRPFAWTGGEAAESKTDTPSRLGALVTLMTDGSVLVAGGDTGGEVGWAEGARPPITAERYDPAVDAWSPMADLPAPLFAVQGLTLSDGSVLLVGGSELEGSGEDVQLIWTGDSYRLVAGQ